MTRDENVTQIAESLDTGRRLCLQDRYDEAARVLAQSIALHPDEALLWCGLANVHYLAGRLEEALETYRRAAAVNPLQPDICAAMANVHHKLGQPEAAAEALAGAIALGATDPALFHNLGNTLVRLGRPDEALKIFEEAVGQFPDHAGLWISLGNQRFEHGDIDDGIKAMRRAVALAPDNDYALKNLARKLYQAWRLEDSTEIYRRVVARDPADSAAAHTLAALTGRTTAATPEDCVREGFDLYAEHFDRHLVDHLGYATPNLLRDQMDRLADGPRVFARAVDLGCGTGLSAAPFRNVCQHLTGVDLSANMLAEAGKKRLYDRLWQNEVTAFLEACGEHFDLLIAADVLVYLGDLAPLFAAAAACTDAGALFVFSTERVADTQLFTIRPTGRYAHSRRYIRQLAQDHCFTLESARTADLRKDRGQWVNGDLFVLKRIAGNAPVRSTSSL